MFSLLSPDIVLYILSFLSLPDVVQLYRVSRGVHRFLVDNESAIYHQLAVLHRFVTPGSSLEHLIKQDKTQGGYLNGTTSWKDLCEYPRQFTTMLC